MARKRTITAGGSWLSPEAQASIDGMAAQPIDVTKPIDMAALDAASQGTFAPGAIPAVKQPRTTGQKIGDTLFDILGLNSGTENMSAEDKKKVNDRQWAMIAQGLMTGGNFAQGLTNGLIGGWNVPGAYQYQQDQNARTDKLQAQADQNAATQAQMQKIMIDYWTKKLGEGQQQQPAATTQAPTLGGQPAQQGMPNAPRPRSLTPPTGRTTNGRRVTF